MAQPACPRRELASNGQEDNLAGSSKKHMAGATKRRLKQVAKAATPRCVSACTKVQERNDQEAADESPSSRKEETTGRKEDAQGTGFSPKRLSPNPVRVFSNRSLLKSKRVEQRQSAEEGPADEKVGSMSEGSGGSPAEESPRDRAYVGNPVKEAPGIPGSSGTSKPSAQPGAKAKSSKLSNNNWSRSSDEDNASDCEDEHAYRTLLRVQAEQLPRILEELERHGYKVSHWIWWVFPTEKPGFADWHGTFITKDRAAGLCTNASTAGLWRQVLEKVCELVEKDGMDVLPDIDHGRIFFFLKFWKSCAGLPTWMQDVCKRLDEYKWEPW